ncbi:MAG: RIP metalloprotease RseP [Gammaproteobacteria bacterium]|nr:RIP metalloprotease RseP [Gammaproteobacteria bacterium]
MFSNVAISALAFIVALGLLISIHEFGHFWVARRMGVKVLRYSIGFGRTLWKRVGKVDDTEFVIAAIPLGGYVKMLDEREADVPAADLHRSFNQKSVWARSAVIIAGPLANILLAIAAYWLVMMLGISGAAPLLGKVTPGSIADEAGFEFEDKLLAVNGQETPSWADARIALLDASLDANGPLEIEVQSNDGSISTRELPVDGVNMLDAVEEDPLVKLGLRGWRPDIKPIVGFLSEGGAAEAAGFIPGDTIIKIDDTDIDSWYDMVFVIQNSANKALLIQVNRGGELLDLNVTPNGVDVDGRTVGRLGVGQDQTTTPEFAKSMERAQVVVRYSPLIALGKAVERTWDMSVLTVRMMGKLITGQASLKNISGPVSIAQYAGQSVSVSFEHYINFIALISLSIAILNLLPIPILDGGHLLFYLFEIIRGKPLPERVQILGHQIGLFLLGSLMLLAFYNDFWRLVQ